MKKGDTVYAVSMESDGKTVVSGILEQKDYPIAFIRGSQELFLSTLLATTEADAIELAIAHAKVRIAMHLDQVRNGQAYLANLEALRGGKEGQG